MSWRNLIWMAIILALAGLAFSLARGRKPRVPPTDPTLDDLAGAVQAYKVIKQRSYRPPATQQACRGAIEGMVRQVDDYSRYVSQASSGRLDRRLDGTVEGTGLLIAESQDKLVTLGPLPQSPAHDAEIYGGNEILAIDAEQAEYLTLDRARELLTRPAGTTVKLRLRDARGKQLLRELPCRRFDIETVTGIVRDDAGRWDCVLDEQADIYYLRISEFIDHTPKQLQDAYRRLGAPAGVVLDLRGNPGGTLAAAVGVVEAFLSKGLIVRTVSRQGTISTHSAHESNTFPPAPLVVLIDERTASAGEVVAGALSVHGRAMLLGQPTHGKWYVQSVVDLPSGLGQLYLTTAEYFLAEPAPSTHPSASAPVRPADQPRPGVAPDVALRLTVRARRQLELLRAKATVIPPPSPKPKRPPPQKQLKRAILDCDEQLAEALRLLKLGRVPTTRPATKRPPQIQEVHP